MTLALTVTLVTGTYDASGAGDRDSHEWPPHPARVFCALVASARDEGDRTALRWLESQEPPRVHAAPLLHSAARQSYVVTNSKNWKPGSQSHPGRTNALRTRTAVISQQAIVHIAWPHEPDDSAIVATLDRLARRVPYLGRSTGVAMLSVSVSASSGTDQDGLDVYEPCRLDQAKHSLRVPYAGYVDALSGLHEAGRPAWEASRAVGYRVVSEPDADTGSAAKPSVYTDLVTLRFTGVKLDGRLAPIVTEALRRAVMANTDEPLPETLHGHDADGRPHVAFLALPAVGSEHSDGHLLGVGVAVPDLPADERRRILRGVLGPRDKDGMFRLRVPTVGELELLYEPGLVKPWGATPERWRRGSKRWVTATPMVLDRFPKRGHEEAEVLRSCSQVGLPTPINVRTSTAPLVSGGIRLRPNDLPRQARGRLYRHVDLTFDRPVNGPMLLGAARYLGVGLLVPLKYEEATDAAV